MKQIHLRLTLYPSPQVIVACIWQCCNGVAQRMELEILSNAGQVPQRHAKSCRWDSSNGVTFQGVLDYVSFFGKYFPTFAWGNTLMVQGQVFHNTTFISAGFLGQSDTLLYL